MICPPLNFRGGFEYLFKYDIIKLEYVFRSVYMKKVVVLNAGPRKNFNTAKMLKAAQKGAETAGAQTEFFDLYDYDFKGCRSCLACQRKDSKTNGVCAVKDDLRPIL